MEETRSAGAVRIQLRSDQQAIKDHPARFKVVACGRRWGKTTLGLALAVEAAQAGQRVWWVAPTFSMAFHPWRDMKHVLQDEWAYKLESEHFIEMPGGGTITVKSAEDPASLRGVGLDLVIVDEAAFTSSEAWFEALRPALSDRDGRAVLLSTPRGRNWFWHVFLRGQDELNSAWQSWQHPTAHNPRIPKEDIAEARDLLSERQFAQEYEAQFLEDGSAVFHLVAQAPRAPQRSEPQPGHRYVMGVDWGRAEDYTVAAVLDADTREMVALLRFREALWSTARARIAGLARRWHVQEVLAEANAMGEPNIEALRAEGLPVTPFTTTHSSKGPLIEQLVKGIEEGEIALLEDEVLIGELEAYTYEVDRYGTPRYFAPPGQHDDTVIALALAWKLAVHPRLVLGILGGGDPFWG